ERIADRSHQPRFLALQADAGGDEHGQQEKDHDGGRPLPLSTATGNLFDLIGSGWSDAHRWTGTSYVPFILTDDAQGPPPACLTEEVDQDVADRLAAIEKRRLPRLARIRIDLVVLMRRRDERPIDEHRPPDEILFGDESPVTAVAADVAIVTHGEIA